MANKTQFQKVNEAIDRLNDVLRCVRPGYPYYNVPQNVAYARKVLNEIKRTYYG